MRVLHEPPPTDPHGVTVMEAVTRVGVVLMRPSTTGRLTMLLIPDRCVADVRAALQRWEAERVAADDATRKQLGSRQHGPNEPEPAIPEADRQRFLDKLYRGPDA